MSVPTWQSCVPTTEWPDGRATRCPCPPARHLRGHVVLDPVEVTCLRDVVQHDAVDNLDLVAQAPLQRSRVAVKPRPVLLHSALEWRELEADKLPRGKDVTHDGPALQLQYHQYLVPGSRVVDDARDLLP